MFRNKVSTIPIIILIIGFGGLTIMSCTASSQEALKKRNPPPVQDVDRTGSTSPPQPLASESALNKKADLLEKIGEGQPLQPANNPTAVKTADIPNKNDDLTKSSGPTGIPPPII